VIGDAAEARFQALRLRYDALLEIPDLAGLQVRIDELDRWPADRRLRDLRDAYVAILDRCQADHLNGEKTVTC